MAFQFKNYVFQPRDDLPRDTTTIDVLKTVAIILMLIDHIGFYLFPDMLWFRLLGRLCVPLWFFLIGFSDKRDVPWQWFAGGGVLLVATLLTGHGPWPLSILFTMAIVRYTIDPVWDYIITKPVYFWWFVMLLGFFGYVSDRVVEYGTIGFLLASVGFVLKNREAVNTRFLGFPFCKTLCLRLVCLEYILYYKALRLSLYRVHQVRRMHRLFSFAGGIALKSM
jgi:hypothetical protein